MLHLTLRHSDTDQNNDKDINIDGFKDILIQSGNNKNATINVKDESLNGMNLRIQYKQGSLYMVGDNVEFVETYKAPSAFF